MTLLDRTRILVLLMVTLVVSPLVRGQNHQRMPVQSLLVSARVGDVSRLDGDVWLRRAGNTGLEPLRVGQKVSAGDVVVTGADGRAEWSLGFDSYFQVGARSLVRIYGTGRNWVHFDIELGEVALNVRTLEGASPIELDTPHALLTIAKRGSYRIVVAPNEDTEAAVADGELRYRNTMGETGKVTKRKRVRFFVKQGTM